MYARVSTREQAESGLGLEAQISRGSHHARAQGWDPSPVADEAVSGTVPPEERPALAAALTDLAGGDAAALVVVRADRLSRTAFDVLAIARQAQQQGWVLAIVDIGLQTGTATGDLLLTVLAGIAQWERALIAERTSDALRAAAARGQRLGRPTEQSPAARAYAVRRRQEGASLRTIAAELTDGGYQTARGGRWHPSTISQLLRSHRLDQAAAEAIQPTLLDS